MKIVKKLMLLGLLVLLTSCDADPFGNNRRTVGSSYEIEFFPDGEMYFLQERGANVQG